MDKCLPDTISFKHIITEIKATKATNTAKTTITKPDPYLTEIVSRMNIINEEFYDYIIYNYNKNNNVSNETKTDVRQYLDKAMVEFFNEFNK